MTNNNMIEQLSDSLGTALEVKSDNFFDYLVIAKEQLHELCLNLKNEWGFNYLANLSGVDYEDKLEVVYHLFSIPDNRKIGIKTSTNRDNATIPSVADIWKSADWQEREAFDLLGIKFSGHPNLIRILLPHDFDGHPLRKDFKMLNL